VSQGVIEGRVRTEVYTPQLQARINHNRAHHRNLGGESLAQVQARKVAWLRQKMQEHEGQTVFAFGHGLAIKALVGFVRQSSFEELLTWKIGYTGYVTVEPDSTTESGYAVTDTVECEL
jgi:broad specificity phosphatase PhoE